MRMLRDAGHDVASASTSSPRPSPTVVGSIADRDFVRASAARASTRSCTRRRCTSRTSATHAARTSSTSNVTGTLNLLEEAAARRRRALRLHEHDERVRPRADAAAGRAGRVDHRRRRARAAEHLRRDEDRGGESLRARPSRHRPAVPRPAHVAVLPRRRRPRDVRDALEDANNKANEFLYRRVDIEDVVDAHLLALERAPAHRLRRATSSARRRRSRATTSPRCARDAPARRAAPVPGLRGRVRAAAAGRCSPSIDRVYVNAKARAELGWPPRYDFRACSTASRPARICAARSRRRSARRATTRSDRPLHRALSRPAPIIARCFISH